MSDRVQHEDAVLALADRILEALGYRGQKWGVYGAAKTAVLAVLRSEDARPGWVTRELLVDELKEGDWLPQWYGETHDEYCAAEERGEV